MLTTETPTATPTPVERVAALLIANGHIVHIDPQTPPTVTVTGRALSTDAAFHWLFAVDATHMVCDATSMRGTTRHGVTVVVPVQVTAAEVTA